MRTAEELIANVPVAARALGLARANEIALEDGRALEKRNAIRRLMQTTNNLTGKPHSASSAEAIVEADADYRAYRDRQAAAVILTQEAWGRYEAAKLAAQLAVNLAAATTGGV